MNKKIIGISTPKGESIWLDEVNEVIAREGAKTIEQHIINPYIAGNTSTITDTPTGSIDQIMHAIRNFPPASKKVILINELYFEEFVDKINNGCLNGVKHTGLFEMFGIKVHSTDNEYRTAKVFLEDGYDEVYIISKENIIVLNQKFLDLISLPKFSLGKI